MTCEEENKDCICCRCDNCKDSLEMFKPSPEDSQILIKYQQWQKADKRAEKVIISATVNGAFDDLKNKMNCFLVHRYIKKKQQDHFTKLTEECDESSAVLQVDFSENVSIVNQNEIQSSHWSHQQINIFTSHVWVNQNVKESFAIISDNLNHTKEAVYTFMSELLATINKKYSSIKLLNIFTDGTTSQSKQGFLFSNLHGWENEFNFKIAWNFFGAINGIGGTVKPSVWRNVCTAIATPNNAIAYYELVKCLNMGIIITCISNDTITEKCAPRLPAWVNTLVVTNAMKLQCIKA